MRTTLLFASLLLAHCTLRPYQRYTPEDSSPTEAMTESGTDTNSQDTVQAPDTITPPSDAADVLSVDAMQESSIFTDERSDVMLAEVSDASAELTEIDASDAMSMPDVMMLPEVIDAGPRTTPRLIAPLSTAMVSTGSPVLQWDPAPDTTGAEVRVCRDRALTSMCQTLMGDSSGRLALAPNTLMPGIWYWNVLNFRSGGVRTAPSATWQFNVLRATATNNTTYGATLDMNGDGYADMAVGTQAGRIYVYLGGADGFSDNSDRRVLVLDPTGSTLAFGTTLANAGDFDGDGFADLAVGSGVSGNVYIIPGGPNGPVNNRRVRITTTATGALALGEVLAGVGDFDQDGYADLLVRAQRRTPSPGYVALVRGRPIVGTEGVIVTTEIPAPMGEPEFGQQMASLGDLDGDGFADFAISARFSGEAPPNGAGRVYLYNGRAAGEPTTPLVFSGTEANANIGSSLTGAVDLDGDGLSDAVFGEPSARNSYGQIHVLYGSTRRSEWTRTAFVTIAPPASGPALFGMTLHALQDLNGDRRGDLLIGVPGIASDPYRVYFGATDRNLTMRSLPRSTEIAEAGFPSLAHSVGDVNGDGLSDAVLLVPTVGGFAGRFALHFGTTSAMFGAPQQLMAPSTSMAPSFGAAVARFAIPAFRERMLVIAEPSWEEHTPVRNTERTQKQTRGVYPTRAIAL